MSLQDKIKEIYPELTDADFFSNGPIVFRKDDDDYEEYIIKWEYDKPIPEGLKLGKDEAKLLLG
jgi:hypothetical protein